MFLTFTAQITANEPARSAILFQALDCFGRRNLAGCHLTDETLLSEVTFENEFEDIDDDLAIVARDHPEFSYVLIGTLLHGNHVASSRFPADFSAAQAKRIVQR
jgi:hypothetical protein